MNDPRRPEQSGRPADEPTLRFPQSYPAYADTAPDPASADHYPQAPRQVPPDRPKTPRWLWVAAAAAVALVVVMVTALVISNNSAQDQAVVSPGPAAPASTTPAATSPPASATPGSTATSPGESGAAAVDAVVYSVTGEGRAISITYRDSGDVMATEFNVALPWSKEVSLPKSGSNANVTVVNIGHEVTCTLTVAGAQVSQHTGVGLTICDAPA
ncbi:hypothetical protein [Mycobacterium sp.]|uniref:hypothetical protein n=1 Tax=Mycobacterium sp. TaxID=1785 RepID=UPI001288501D|nr:hypothetical protein [Mycobacterium sp.]KAA8969576.1 MAG: hypothetical protein F6Q13_02815 [Mycobacterium sp.]